ncbi:MAG TPA: STAS/SEC14 domain-containing protein [Planctomycetota bacterium]|nr:STAS/SEC14 domain-containing protein [Planctomycetota bacterium]
MLRHDLLPDKGILILHPESSLRAGDFAELARLVDPYIENNGELKGILVEAVAFPGWESFAGLISHLKFVKNHHRLVRRIAIVSDNKLLTVVPKFASHFVSAEVNTFEAGGREAALAWLASP